MMEDLLEFLLELILEGAVEGSKSRRIPKVLRFILLAIPFLVGIGLFGLIAHSCFTAGTVWFGVICIALIFAAVIGYVVMAYRIIREIPRKKRKEQPGNENPDEE